MCSHGTARKNKLGQSEVVGRTALCTQRARRQSDVGEQEVVMWSGGARERQSHGHQK